MCKVARGRVLRRTERKAPREAAPWRPERRGSEADSARCRGAWRNAGANPSGARRGGSSPGCAHTRATGQRRPSGGFARSARLPEQETTVPAAPRGGRALVGTARRAVGLRQTPAAGGKGAASRRSQQEPWAWENKLRELQGNADVFGPTKTLSHRRTCLLKGKMKECCSK